MYGWIWSNSKVTFTYENESGKEIKVCGVSESENHPYKFPDVKCVGKVTKFIRVNNKKQNSLFETIDSLYNDINIIK